MMTMTTMTTTTTTTRSGRSLSAAARLARMRELVAARDWQLIVDEPRGIYSARKLEWQNPAGLRVGWTEYHQHGVRTLWVEHEDTTIRDRILEELCAELPTWSDEALRREAHCADLRARLPAVRTWVVTAAIDPERTPGMIDAIVALARHEHPVARLAAYDLAWVIASAHREAVLALARERAEGDPQFAAEWQHLLTSLENPE
jgi:hypothetical protein